MRTPVTIQGPAVAVLAGNGEGPEIELHAFACLEAPETHSWI